MCLHSYEKLSNKTGEIMIFCHLKDNESNELMQLCVSQRFCNKKDKYIPSDQKKYCKYYE